MPSIRLRNNGSMHETAPVLLFRRVLCVSKNALKKEREKENCIAENNGKLPTLNSITILVVHRLILPVSRLQEPRFLSKRRPRDAKLHEAICKHASNFLARNEARRISLRASRLQFRHLFFFKLTPFCSEGTKEVINFIFSVKKKRKKECMYPITLMEEKTKKSET